MKPTRQQAAVTILRRRRAKETLSSFADYIEIPGTPISDDPEEEQFNLVETSLAKHHYMICDVMQGLIQGTLEYDGERVNGAMLFMPPGSAKSTYGTVVAPVWAMGNYPGYNIISTSYGSQLAYKQSRKSRQIVKSARYRAIFNTGLQQDNKSVEDWALDNGSTNRAAGILAGVTGNRADGIVIDDPIKGRQDADSETIRNSTKDAIDDDLMTRLKPNGWVVYILTRWHEDDPVGRLLPEDWDGHTGYVKCKDGLVYYVLSIAAQCDDKNDPLGRKIGEYFWPEWFPETHWIRFKSNARTWASLYQQKPSPDDGDFYKREWFQRYYPEDLPENINTYGTSDFAVSEDDGDFTEHTVWGLDEEDNSYAVANWHGQTTADVWIEELLNLHDEHETLTWFGEGGVIRKAIEPFLNKSMEDRRSYPYMEWINPIHNKVISSRSFQGRAAQGKVFIPYGPEGDRMIEYLVKFPYGKYDDFPDNCALWGRALDETDRVVLPQPINRVKVNRYFNKTEKDSWKTA